MTYAQIGSTHQIGTSSQIGPSDWSVEGRIPGSLLKTEVTHAGLRLAWRTDTAGKDYLRQATRASGKQNRILRSGGDWRTKDLSSLGNTLQITPPGDEQPPLGPAMYLVESADEEPVGQQAQRYRVDIEVVRREPIPRDFSQGWTDEVQGTNEWLFALHYGDVASGRVEWSPVKGARAGVASHQIRVILDAEQTAVWMESLSRLDAQRERDIPDGDNYVDDVTSSDRNTVHVTPPGGGERLISEDDYVVREWRATRLNKAYWRVEAGLAETG